MDRERQLILIIENAQLVLKKIIRDDIINDEDRYKTKVKVLSLIESTKVALIETGADEDFVNEFEIAFKKAFIMWYELIYKELKNLDITQNLMVLDNADKKESGLIIDDTSLRKAEVKNIREFMTLYEEGGAGYYYDYAKEVDKIIGQLSDSNAIIGNRSIRAVAETKVRYDIINEDLKKIQDKGVKYVVSTAHANSSERCQWWQGKIFIIDLDIATREMGQYDGVKPHQTIKGYIDGKPYYSLKEACENGFLSYNCQHRLVAYYKGIHLPKYNLIEVKRKRNITEHQRYLERKIRNVKTKQELSILPDDVKKYKDKVKSLKNEYKNFCKKNNVPRYDWRTQIID